MSISSSFIERLLASVNIVDIIGRRVTLERKGGGYWAKCPFHGSGEEKTASFKVYEETGTCLLYTSPSPRDLSTSRMPSSA